MLLKLFISLHCGVTFTKIGQKLRCMKKRTVHTDQVSLSHTDCNLFVSTCTLALILSCWCWWQNIVINVAPGPSLKLTNDTFCNVIAYQFRLGGDEVILSNMCLTTIKGVFGPKPCFSKPNQVLLLRKPNKYLCSLNRTKYLYCLNLTNFFYFPEPNQVFLLHNAQTNYFYCINLAKYIHRLHIAKLLSFQTPVHDWKENLGTMCDWARWTIWSGYDGDGASIIIGEKMWKIVSGLGLCVYVSVGKSWGGWSEVLQNHALHVTVLIETLWLTEMERMRSRPKWEVRAVGPELGW